MRVVPYLLNRSEGRVDRELHLIANDEGLRIFPKMRLSDVIDKEGTHLTQREFDFYTRSHFDFVISDAENRPLMAVEYDGPLHQTEPKQAERDRIKDDLCRTAGFGLLRINDRHVSKLYRGMTLLRWIIEVRGLEAAFYAAQAEGQIPQDEAFDPAFFAGVSTKGSNRWPYWLSLDATQSIHAFFKVVGPDVPKAWTSIVGSDEKDNSFRLSWISFNDQVLWAKTGVRKQLLEFPHYDLLDQLDTCELGIRLKKYRAGQIEASSWRDFEPVLREFERKYNAHPSHSMTSGRGGNSEAD